MTNQKEKRKVPELRFPEFSGEWERKLWGDLGEYKKSYSYSRAYEEEGIFRHIHYGDIHTKLGPNINNLDELNSINVNDIHELVQYGDLIIADASEDYKDLGKVTRLNINDSNIISGLHTHLFRVNNNIDSRFLLYYSKTSKYQKLIRRYGTGVSVLGLSKVNLNKFDINLPSFEEQQKIGEFFSKLDRQIELEEKKLALLEEQKKGYMQKIFSRELRFKDENGEEYPEWRWTNIKNEIDLITDYVSNGSFESLRKNVSYSSNSDYAIVIRLQDANNDWKGPFVYTNKEGYEFLSKTKLYKNDLIMSNVGSVGVFYRIPELEKPMTLGPNSILLRSKKNNNTFLYYFLNSHELRKRVFEKSTPGVQPKINKTDLKSISFNLPSIDEQNIIANLFDCIEKSLVNIKNRKYKREILKKELLNRMFL